MRGGKKKPGRGGRYTAGDKGKVAVVGLCFSHGTYCFFATFACLIW